MQVVCIVRHMQPDIHGYMVDVLGDGWQLTLPPVDDAGVQQNGVRVKMEGARCAGVRAWGGQGA